MQVSRITRFKTAAVRESVRRAAARVVAAALGGCVGVIAANVALADPPPAAQQLITGKSISPVGTTQDVGSMPMNLIKSPDGKYAVSTDMGFRQSLWVVRTSDGVGVSHIDFPNDQVATNGLYYGLAFGSDGKLYAAQGQNDSIAVLTLSSAGQLSQVGTIKTKKGDFPSGLAADGHGHLFVANNDPDTFAAPSSIAVYDLSTLAEIGRFAFTSSFGGTPNFPLGVAVMGDGSKVYVSSQRDGAVYVLDTSNFGHITQKALLSTGSHPTAVLLNKGEDQLFVANGHSDTVSVVSTASDSVVTTLRVRGTGSPVGATPDGLALSSDEKTLYVTLGDMNAVAVIDLQEGGLDGYIPTGWYPTGVVVTPGDSQILVTNAKGSKTRYPNPGYKFGTFEGQYTLNLIEGQVNAISLPKNNGSLQQWTKQVLDNNSLVGNGQDNNGQDKKAADFIDHRLDSVGLKAGKIKHVIYIVKENRTFDQILGDINVAGANVDPSLVMFGNDVTPNQHALAKRFVLLDNFYDCGEASGDGWPWSTSSVANEYVIKNLPYNYSGRGRNYDFEGQNNGYPAGGFPAKGIDNNQLSQAFPNGLPPIPDVAEGPSGHIWDAVRASGVSYRNYGFFGAFGVTQGGVVIIPDNWPSAKGLLPPGHDLDGITDYDFYHYDNNYPDSDAPNIYGAKYSRLTYGKHNAVSRFSEWNTEFQEMLKKDPTGGVVPGYMTVRFNHDHTQGYSSGTFSPRAEVADNDYAVGQLVDAISHSPIWKETAIFVIEDDAQDGPDHVDCHRSTCYVISPLIKANSLDHTFYNTDSVLKTMEMLLGVPPLTQYDAFANPILVFGDDASNDGPFNAILPPQSIIAEKNPVVMTLKAGDPMLELVRKSDKMDFVHPDSAPARELNEILWKGIRGTSTAMPEPRHMLASSLRNSKAVVKTDAPAGKKVRDDDDH
jgi:YVTN family beta-propeller protein